MMPRKRACGARCWRRRARQKAYPHTCRPISSRSRASRPAGDASFSIRPAMHGMLLLLADTPARPFLLRHASSSSSSIFFFFAMGYRLLLFFFGFFASKACRAPAHATPPFAAASCFSASLRCCLQPFSPASPQHQPRRLLLLLLLQPAFWLLRLLASLDAG